MLESADNVAVGGATKGSRMVIVGLGGGGGNAVARMHAGWSDGPAVAAVHTDSQALSTCRVPVRVQIGKGITQGLGAGGDPAVGKLAAEDDGDSLRELVSQADIVVIVAALGGGTGTGAAPIMARIAREQGAMTLCFATTPFDFEGELKTRHAEEGLRALRMQGDVVITLPNQRLLELVETQTGLVDAFSKADVMLGVGVRSLWKLLSKAGIINLDFADVRTIMKSSGRALMGIGTAEGENRAVAAAEKAIICPLLENSTIEGATRVIVNILGGNDIGMKEVHDAVSTVQQAAHPSANIIFGAVVDEQERSELKVTVIAAGFIEAPARVLPFTHPQLIRKAQEPAVSSAHAADAPTQEPNAPAKAPAMSNVAPTPAPASATMPEPVSSPIRHTQANPAKPEQEPARRPVSPVQNPAKEVPTPVTKPQNSQAAPAQAAPRPDPNQPRPRIKVPQAAVSGKEPMPVLPEAIDEWMEDDIPPVQIMFPIAPDAEEANPADEIEDEEDISIPTFIRNRMSSPSR